MLAVYPRSLSFLLRSFLLVWVVFLLLESPLSVLNRCRDFDTRKNQEKNKAKKENGSSVMCGRKNGPHVFVNFCLHKVREATVFAI